MARIRTIKPEFCQSEKIGRLSRDARLCFIQIWTVVDDEGRARAAPRLLAGSLYPYDDDAPALIEGWLDELARNGRISRYVVDGTQYLQVTNWSEHQRIEKKSASRYPAPKASDPVALQEVLPTPQPKVEDASPPIPGTLPEPSRTDMDLGSGSGREREFRLTAGDGPIEPEVPAEIEQPPPSKPKPDQDADLFRRGREVLGKSGGGLISGLKTHFEGNIPKARAALETASTKHDPREYLGRIINGSTGPPNGELYDRSI